MRIKESLNVRFDESPPPKSSPLVDDDIIKSQIIEKQIQELEDKKNRPLNKEIINIKESKDHSLETVIGKLNDRTFEHEHVVMNPTLAGMRHHHLHLYIQRISLTGFPAQSVGSSNTDVLDLPCLLVLITETSQSRQHEGFPFVIVNTKEYHSERSGRITRIMRRTLVNSLLEQTATYSILTNSVEEKVNSSQGVSSWTMRQFLLRDKTRRAGEVVHCITGYHDVRASMSAINIVILTAYCTSWMFDEVYQADSFVRPPVLLRVKHSTYQWSGLDTKTFLRGRALVNNMSAIGILVLTKVQINFTFHLFLYGSDTSMDMLGPGVLQRDCYDIGL
ncbi:hypothetical protein Tco_1293141 [Tanacetum coccineum]